MMTMAKRITSGYFPFGAGMVSEAVVEVFETCDPNLAAIFHGYTYSAHPVGSTAALTCIRETQRMKINANVAPRGSQLFNGLLFLKDKYDIVGGVHGGHGLMTALELVSDTNAKTPAAPSSVSEVFNVAYEAGAMVRIGGNNLLMSPPLIISEGEIATILEALDAGLSVVSA